MNGQIMQEYLNTRQGKPLMQGRALWKAVALDGLFDNFRPLCW